MSTFKRSIVSVFTFGLVAAIVSFWVLGDSADRPAEGRSEAGIVGPKLTVPEDPAESASIDPHSTALAPTRAAAKNSVVAGIGAPPYSFEVAAAYPVKVHAPAKVEASLLSRLQWPNARLIDMFRSEPDPEGLFRRVYLLQPADLPYTIRVEEIAVQGEGAAQTERVLRKTEMVADHILVQREAAQSEADLRRILAGLGGELGKRISPRGLYRARVPHLTADAAPELVAQAEALGTLAYAEPDYIVRATATPNDPYYTDGHLWGLHNTGQAAFPEDRDEGETGTADADIDAPEAWDIRTDASSVIVAVIDTGINYNHEDLAGNMWVNSGETAGDGIDNDGNGVIDDVYGLNAITDGGDPLDDNDHGTHCAGTIGGVGNNGVGITGVAWQVQLMAGKFLSESGSGAASDAVEAIDYAVAMGADIISNSWGGGNYSQATFDAIAAARDADAIFTVAAGNSTEDNDLAMTYPSSYEVSNIVSVAALDRQDELASFSNYGFGSVQLGAPGVAIWSSVHGGNDAYDTFSGTSMACPHVSGVLALLLAEYPSESIYQIINRLLTSVDPVGSISDSVQTGGRLNAHRALTQSSTRPFNDDFADRVVLQEWLNYIRAHNFEATAEVGEPQLDGSSAHDTTLWYSITATVDGEIGIRTSDSDFDTVVGVFTGSDLGSLTAEPTLTGASSGNAFFDGVAGTTYHIAVSGQNGAEGMLSLRVAGPPENNNLADAFEIGGISGFSSGTLFNADKEPSEPNHGGNAGGVSIWWKWTCPSSAEMAVSTRTRLDRLHNTLLGVYTSSDPENPTMANLSLVGENDDEPGLVSSRVKFQAVTGETYFFAIDGKNGSAGDVVIDLFAPPTNDDFEDAFALYGSLPLSINGTNRRASAELGEPDHAGQTSQTSVWYSWTPSEDVTVAISTEGSSDTVLGVYTGASVDALTEIASDDDSGSNVNAQVAFDAQRNTTYYIAVDYLDFFLGSSFGLNVEEVVIPDNDAISNAELIEGGTASISGSNIGAGYEAGEPGGGASSFNTVWFKWVAPASETYGFYFDTETDVSPIAFIYTGTDLSGYSDFTEVAEDRRSGIGYDSFAELDAVAGQTYYIQVSGYSNGKLIFDLDVKPIAEFRPENDMIVAATAIDPAAGLHYLHTHNYAATEETGEPSHGGKGSNRTLWWRIDIGAGQAGQYVFSPAGTEADEVGIAVYTSATPASPDVSSLTLTADNTASTDDTYTEVVWDAVEGETYFIGLETKFADYLGVGRVIVTCQQVAPNGTFASAIDIPAGGGDWTAYNHGAAHQAGEPDPGTGAGKKSLWWRFTPTETAVYQIDTFGSERYFHERNEQSYLSGTTLRAMDTQLGIYTGSAYDSLTTIEDVDSYTNESYDLTWSTSNRWSRIVRELTAGTTYYFLVDGENIGFEQQTDATTTGLVHLNVAKLDPPANDDFADAIELTGSGTLQAITSNLGATKESGEPLHGLSTGGQSLWWKWTAPDSDTYFASSAGLLYDDSAVRNTGVGVYTGSAVNNLTTVGADDDSAGFNSDSAGIVSFNASAGTTYYFAVDTDDKGFLGGPDGNVSLILTKAPAHDDFVNAREMTGTRWTDSSHNIGASMESGEPLIEYWNPQPTHNRKSVWWRWTAPNTGFVTVDTYGSQHVPMLGVFTGSDVSSLGVVAWNQSSGDPWNGHDREIRGNREVSFSATAGNTYYICVQGAGYTEPIESLIQLNLDGPPGIPATPTGFVANRVGDNEVQLTWNDVATDEDVYVLERSTNQIDWSIVDAQIAEDSESYVDYGVVAGQEAYYYRLHAEGSGGVGAAAVTSTAPPSTPSTFQASGVDSQQIDLTWENVSYESGYIVERSATGDGSWAQLATLGADVSSFSDTGLNAATRYYYRVKATGNGESGYSAVASATTGAGEALQVYEGFNYSTGAALGNGNGGSGWGGAWAASGDSNGTVSGSSTAALTAGSMSTPSGYTATVEGNRLGNASQGVQAVRVLDQTIDLGTDGTTYFSFIARTSGGGSAAYASMGFYEDGTFSNKVFDALIWNSQFWIREGGTNVSGGAYAAGTEVLLIGKITRQATGNDTLSLQQYTLSDTIGSEPTTWAIEHDLDSTKVVNRIALEFSNNIEYLDEIRIGASFASVHQATVTPAAPAAPSQLSGDGSAPDTVALSWNDNSANETGFVVERSADGVSGWSVLANLSADTLTYSDTGLASQSTWFYRVQATNAVGASAYSDAVSVTTPTSFGLWAGTEGVSDPQNDGDQDGIVALLEYAFNLDLTESSTVPMGLEMQNVEGTDYMVINFPRVLAASDLVYIVEYSTDLSDWNSASPLWRSDSSDATYLVERTDNGDGTETITVRQFGTLGGNSREFLRVVVEQL